MVDGQISVEIVYALPDEQALEQLTVPDDSTVGAVIERSGLLERFPEIDLTTNKVGVFGKLADLDTRLREGDRVEIYRPLIADPKEARKRRAAERKATKKGAREKDGDQSS